jgi:hypothetical protein
MNDTFASPDADRRQALMDEMLRTGIPEVKLALGELIDRENARPLPAKYARLLPPTILRVAVRDDAAEALGPIAGNLERELTDSCNRHGSLYDRRYRVELRRAEDSDAPLYAVTAVAGRDEGDHPDAPVSGAGEPSAVRAANMGGTNTPAGEASVPEPPASDLALPTADSDATRLGADPPPGWQPGRWILVVEGATDEPREVFRISEPMVTVGRSANNPGLRPTIAISDAPHVSRRQLALSWEKRDDRPGFRVYNLGLNDVHLGECAIPGANAGRVDIELTSVPEAHTGWLPPDVPLRIGEHGPTLRIDEVPEDRDPEATVFD